MTTEFATGAFASVELRELLSQEEVGEALELLRPTAGVYWAPGRAPAGRDV